MRRGNQNVLNIIKCKVYEACSISMLVAVKVEEVTIHYLVTGYGVFEGEKWTLCKLGETNRCSHTAGNAGV